MQYLFLQYVRVFEAVLGNGTTVQIKLKIILTKLKFSTNACLIPICKIILLNNVGSSQRLSFQGFKVIANIEVISDVL